MPRLCPLAACFARAFLILALCSPRAFGQAPFPGLESSLDEVWVQFDHADTEDGSAGQPFDSIYEGLHATAGGGTLHILAGNTPVTPRFSKPMTIVSIGGTARIGARPEIPPITWPISGTVAPDGPLSSTFGPRLKASENFRYDYHRGIDIPTPVGTDVLAIADGIVRIAGADPSYSDMIVQLIHEDSDGSTFYSNSIHMSAVSVVEDQVVLQGGVVGQSGVGEGGFPHLHFETRKDGLYQRNNVSPFVYLPYDDDRTPPQLTIDSVDTSTPTLPQITLTVAIPRANATDALDFNSVTVTTWRDDGDVATLLDTHTFDMNQWNFDFTPLPPGDPNFNLDNAEFNGVVVAPAEFTTASEVYKIQFTFTDLAGAANPAQLMVTAIAKDILGHTLEMQY